MSLGIIGGSGIYEINGVSCIDSISLETPYGKPSCAIRKCEFEGREVYFLPRHGINHTLMPSEINHKANIFALKQLGVNQIVSISAVGSLREELRPGDIVLPDQYFDRTKTSSRHTFFGNGIVAHIGFADPTCCLLREKIKAVADQVISEMKLTDITTHMSGTYVNMEGPAFSTKAESHTYRKLGFDIIGMTSLAEAKLCREAEICYACMAMVTDYDCWHEEEEAVSVEMVIAVLKANSTLAKEIAKQLIVQQDRQSECSCQQALAGAIMTNPASIPDQLKKIMAPITGKYLT